MKEKSERRGGRRARQGERRKRSEECDEELEENGVIWKEKKEKMKMK